MVFKLNPHNVSAENQTTSLVIVIINQVEYEFPIY